MGKGERTICGAEDVVRSIVRLLPVCYKGVGVYHFGCRNEVFFPPFLLVHRVVESGSC